MSPKSNRSGVSYDENDPRGLNLPLQRDNAGGPVVTRARDMEAAREGLQAPGPELADEDEPEIDKAEETEEVEEAVDYGAWTKVQLNEELDLRAIPHDPKANNAVLIELLERSDGRETITGVND